MNISEGENKLHFSIRHIFYVLASFFGIIFLLYFGRPVLVPLAFAFLLSLILYPVSRFFERHGVSRMWSTSWTLILVVLLILGITVLFSTQIIKILQEFDDFKGKLNSLLSSVIAFLNERLPMEADIEEQNLSEMGRRWFSGQSGIVTTTVSRTALIITNIILMVIYTFLILLYRSGLKRAFVKFAAAEKREYYALMVTDMQRVGQKYITGMFILMLILGVLNSLGLFLLGIDYALFFGFFAALLALIPYIGTTLGGAIPALYALMHYESYWYPVGVVLIFWFIQVIESNILNPKIVGGNLNLNALVAILALIFGGLIWGIPGMVLFLPYLAIFKVACEHYAELEPLSYVLKDNLYKEHDQESGLEKKIKKIYGKWK